MRDSLHQIDGDAETEMIVVFVASYCMVKVVTAMITIMAMIMTIPMVMKILNPRLNNLRLQYFIMYKWNIPPIFEKE